MKNLGVAFDILPDHKAPPVGYKRASDGIIFDVKMDFTCKTCWVKHGHRTPDHVGLKYTGVVSRDTV